MRELLVIDSATETPLTRLLRTLGADFRAVSLEEEANGRDPAGRESVLIITEERLAQALDVARSQNERLPKFFSRFVCALVFPVQGSSTGVNALREWTGGAVESKQLDPANCDYSVARLAVCGPFAGMQFGPANVTQDFGLVYKNSAAPVEYLIRVGQCGVFTRIKLPETELFVVSSSAVSEVEAEVFQNISAVECFSGLVPLLLFLNHSKVACWQSTQRTANIVIDDLNLRPKYGFVNFQELARCVEGLRCAVSIGFIPWNFTRTSQRVVDLFRPRWPALSLSIHGCDHTRSEFSTQTATRASQQIRLSLDRMRRLSTGSGLRYDKVMVFPQGEFSAAAMQALGRSDLLGVVNTELMDRQTGRGVRAGELLKLAITSYAGFPLFLRRKADEPIANFALDLLLGKPCLVATHHDFFRSGMQPLISLVQALNALAPSLAWTNLEAVVSKAYSVCAAPDQSIDVRLFSPHTEVPASDSPGDVRFSKAEPLADESFRVVVDGEPQAYTMEDGHLVFRRRVCTEKPVTIDVKMLAADLTPPTDQPISYRARVAVRRYLSEFRDNRVAKSSWATAAVASTRKLVSRLRGRSGPH